MNYNVSNSDTTMVKWDELYSAGQDLANYSENDIKNQIEKIQELRKQVNWEGADAESSLKGFDEFMTEMQKLSQGLAKYGKFLQAAAGQYKDTSNKIKDKFENEVYQVER
jgi:uncharacterized protein YukE